MSEENVSKLRLKPKLVAEPEVALRQPVVNPIAPEAPLPVVADAAKLVRLKPKLSAASAQTVEVNAPSTPTQASADFPPAPNVFPPAVGGDLPPEAEKTAARFSLKPKAPVASPSLTFPPPPPSPIATENDGPALSIPIPAPVFVDPEQSVMPPPVAFPRALTARPFPPPPANFPPPPDGGGRPVPPWAQNGVRGPAPKKNFGLIAGGVVVVLLVFGGGFAAYKKFTTVPAPAPAAPILVVAKPAAPASAVQALVEQAKQQADAPINEVLAPPPAPAVESKSAQAILAEAKPDPAPVPAEVELPRPPPSAAFKAWVDSLRVGGVRPGANPRVFIGGNSYQAGEVVNLQLGIIFDSYNADTRKLTFRDKTGARIDRRN